MDLDGPLPPEVHLVSLPAELERAIPRRQMQFRAGRYCAQRAIHALDPHFEDFEIGRYANGAPVWPAPLTGSITHTDGFAAAAVALKTDVAGIGIDTERFMSASQASEVAHLIALPGEIDRARAAGMSYAEGLTLVFSAKESIFKCLHPTVGRYFDFQDVCVEGVDHRLWTFSARLVSTLSTSLPAGTTLHGGFGVESAWVHTGLTLPSQARGDR